MGGNTNQFRGRRLAAVLGAITLSLVGAAGGATAAFAADYGNVDNTKDGSIIIHKHVLSGTAQAGSPDGGTNTITSDPVSGVVFTAYKLTNLDLTTSLGWSGLPSSAPTTACDTTTPILAGQTLGTAIVSPATDVNGLTTISLTHPAAVGAYLVCETFAPPAVVDKTQPFLVTVPYAYNEGWLYNVNVYPKNGLASVTKTVAAQSSLGLGSTASFAVTTDVPKVASNANFQYYWIQDAMDSRMTGAVASVKVASTGTDVLSTYYTKTTVGANVVTVQFNTAGLTWLSTLGQAKITTTFTGVVNSLGNGIVNDTAYLGTKTAVAAVPAVPALAPNDPSSTPSMVSSAKITQNWGDLKLSKVDAGSALIGLANAKFQVWAAADPYAATCAIATTGSAIPVGSVTDFTTGIGGALTIAGLFVSDNKNGTIDAAQRCYVLVETAAPAGFVLPTGNAAKTAVAVKTGVTSGLDSTVQNTRISGIVLPMTGSNGIVVLSVAGLALIAAGIVLAFLARRRRQTA